MAQPSTRNVSTSHTARSQGRAHDGVSGEREGEQQIDWGKKHVQQSLHEFNRNANHFAEFKPGVKPLADILELHPHEATPVLSIRGHQNHKRDIPASPDEKEVVRGPCSGAEHVVQAPTPLHALHNVVLAIHGHQNRKRARRRQAAITKVGNRRTSRSPLEEAQTKGGLSKSDNVQNPA